MPLKNIFLPIIFCIYGVLSVHATPFVLDTTNLDIQSYKDKKMDEIQGAWVQYAGAGLVGGYLGYMGYASSVPRSQRARGGVTTAMGSGAVGGALTLTPIGVTRAAFLGGTVGFAGNQAAISSSRG